MPVPSQYWLRGWLSFLKLNHIDVICISVNRSIKMRQITINGLPSYWMAHTEQSFSFLSLIFHKRKSQSEAAGAEKSKSLWHLNNKAMLVYFLCKKSSVRKRLLWNTCHSPFYWTLFTARFFWPQGHSIIGSNITFSIGNGLGELGRKTHREIPSTLTGGQLR